MTSTVLSMTAPGDVYRARRARLAASLSRPMVLMAGRARSRNYPDNTFPFRAASSYLYFGGPPLQGAALVIEPASDGQTGCTLLRHAQTLDEQVWMGTGPSDAQIAHAAGLLETCLADLDQLGRILSGRPAAVLIPICPHAREWARSAALLEPDQHELLAVIQLRMIKDEHELAAMRRAADIGVQAHLAARRAAVPGAAEADVAAAIFQVMAAHRAEVSFNPIVTIRGDILHTESYCRTLDRGRLLLVDAGAEEPTGYASDATRTYPVGGSFDGIQRQLYETVLRAEKQAIAACVPGARYRDVHDVAAQAICEGLVAAGLLMGDPTDLCARRAHTLFFTHGVGHLIGLDVHDMEDFGDLAGYAPGRRRRAAFGDKFLRLDRDLVPGMTVTIEPGLYLVPAIWRHEALIAPFRDAVNFKAVERLLENEFGGIRVEDTIHVTSDGPEILTAALPREAADVVA